MTVSVWITKMMHADLKIISKDIGVHIYIGINIGIT